MGKALLFWVKQAGLSADAEWPILIYCSITSHLSAKYKPPYWTQEIRTAIAIWHDAGPRDISKTHLSSVVIYTAALSELMFEYFISGIILGNRPFVSHPFHDLGLWGTVVMATENHLECGPSGCCWVSEWVLTVACGNWTLNTVRVHWKQGYFTLDVILGESFIVV